MKFLTKEQKESFEKCEKEYVKDKKCCKIRGHCHYTGEYRSAAYNICN